MSKNYIIDIGTEFEFKFCHFGDVAYGYYTR